jgi:8-amino-7-oxononanoate synthase
MSDVSKMLRQKRFRVEKPASVVLVIETAQGEKHELSLRNCALGGLGCEADAKGQFEIGQIIPAAKLKAGNKEHALGRLVVRRISEDPSNTELGFSTIDAKVPVESFLNKYLAAEFDAPHQSPYDYELSPERANIGTFAALPDNATDIFHRAVQFDIFFQEWEKSAKYQYRNVRVASMGGRVNLRHKRRNGREDYLVMGSNDYLGLATHPEVIAAAKSAIDTYGFGSTGSPLTTGITEIHEELSSELEKIFRKERVILFNSGYAANVGAIAGLTREQDLVLADVISHASLQDAMSLSKATSRFFKHNDVAHLEKLLQEQRAEHAGALVITEGVFSMDGDLARLDEVARVARRYDARLFVDEAHSFGVVGKNGLGCWEKFPNSEVDIIMGTFSKICGGIGGFIATNQAVANWLSFHARAHIFSVTIPPSTAAAALAALKVFQANPHLRETLKSNIRHFVTGLRDLGCPIAPNHESAVIPVIIGDEIKLGEMNEVFRNHGVYVIPITYPAVGRTNSRFRFTIMATHSTSDRDYVLNIIEMAMMKANFQFANPTNERNLYVA